MLYLRAYDMTHDGLKYFETYRNDKNENPISVVSNENVVHGRDETPQYKLY